MNTAVAAGLNVISALVSKDRSNLPVCVCVCVCAAGVRSIPEVAGELRAERASGQETHQPGLCGPATGAV